LIPCRRSEGIGKGLRVRELLKSDVWFIEPSIGIDDRIAQPVKSAYPGVAFYGAYETAYSSACTYNSSDPSLASITETLIYQVPNYRSACFFNIPHPHAHYEGTWTCSVTLHL